ncbi:MAG TPA: hypothetical protein VN903_32735 [Polyangia bacterium]|nr:hypothetical protein [Polyangia bacterium]
MSDIDTTPAPERSHAEEETPQKMHNFSAYIHVGPGAEECEHREDGRCADRDHFHGWVRLPNQFERKSISDKAIAAEARKLRAFRDPESSDSVVLDNEIDAIVARDDREALIDEVVGADFLQDHIRAVKEIGEEDEQEDGEWATIEEDRERLNALRGKSPEDRNEEEFEELGSRIARHAELVNARREEIQAPRRQALADTSIADLGTMVRQLRVEQMGNGIRREEALKWEMYVCTMKPKSPDKPGFPNERAFSSIDTFVAAPSEVLEPIANTVTRLNQEAGSHLKG